MFPSLKGGFPSDSRNNSGDLTPLLIPSGTSTSSESAMPVKREASSASPPSLAQRLSRTFASGRSPKGSGASSSPPRRPKESPLDVAEMKPTTPFKNGKLFPVIPGRLSWCAHVSDNQTRRQIANYPDKFFFSDNHQELYEPFCADFGPLNLSVVHNFCGMMRSRMADPRLKRLEIVSYSDNAVEIRTNTAFLIAAYLMVDCGKTAEQAWEPFSRIGASAGSNEEPFAAYHDATYCSGGYGLSVLSCLQGLHKGMTLGWYSTPRFNLKDYLLLDDPSFADMHVLCPKFAAFKGPSKVKKKLMEGIYMFTPQHYVELFKERGITAVIRLNEPIYDANVFTQNGIQHHDLYFDDCTEPSPAIVQKFIEICEQEPGRVAVHCKAGLGRTGTLIALYWMKHHGLTAAECMGWLRVVRPGSVIGPQQQFLHRVEHLYRKGAERRTGSPVLHPKGSMSAERSAQLGLEVAAAQNARSAHRMGKGGTAASAQPPQQLPALKSR
mmetsp:Transcript_33158/g.83685  ORF Transcript_33158/g.83685 Transcript_33158/m.83685 type:complete len:496 (+) Transcript_33158:193-1680(+)